MKMKFPMVAKTATYGLMHMVISFLIAGFVTWYMTGDVRSSMQVALGISLLEPSIQIFGYFLHERAWQKWGKSHPDQKTEPLVCPHDHKDGHHHHGHKH